MYDKLIKKILETVDEGKISDNLYPKFSGDGYIPCKISTENFHEIKTPLSHRKIAFVDGGNAELIGSSNFSLNMIRVGYVIYEGRKRISSKKFELLAFVESIREKDEIYYKTTFFDAGNLLDLGEVSFSSLDKTLMKGVNRADISSVANAIRRFAELKTAKLISDSRLSDAIVLDGNLQSTLSNERKYLDELFGSCPKNKITICALSKTTSLFTDDGNQLSFVLNSISQHDRWSYYPIVRIENKDHKADMYFVKFHDKSKHIFRLEILNEQNNKAEEIIASLATGCTDPIFIGYPYGLIEADRIARVSNQEKESFKTMLMVRIKDKNVEKYLSSVNAHEILDKISF